GVRHHVGGSARHYVGGGALYHQFQQNTLPLMNTLRKTFNGMNLQQRIEDINALTKTGVEANKLNMVTALLNPTWSGMRNNDVTAAAEVLTNIENAHLILGNKSQNIKKIPFMSYSDSASILNLIVKGAPAPAQALAPITHKGIIAPNPAKAVAVLVNINRATNDAHEIVSLMDTDAIAQMIAADANNSLKPILEACEAKDIAKAFETPIQAAAAAAAAAGAAAAAAAAAEGVRWILYAREYGAPCNSRIEPDYCS
ncbi:MAG: hypothetical protein EBU34_11845, partial [Alphaproteobacteria bacterium]|nr:hypothetical protein [Alphaproteobacteria bacterium]